MQWWYDIVNMLPFEWAEEGKMIFMKNALLAVILMMPVFAILGTMIVNKRMAFFSDALGHGAFTGVVIGAIMGFVQPMWSAVVFSIVFSLVVAVIKQKSGMASDTIIGVVSATAIALGIFLATMGGGSFSKLNAFLIGDILSITPDEILMLAMVLLFIVLFWIFIFNKLLLVSINSSFASSRGINTLWYEVIFSTGVAIVVTLSISWVGLLVINSFLILPAAAARNISNNQRSYHITAIIIALISGIAGLFFSYYAETSSGATIILISSVIFFVTFFLRKRFA